MDTLNVGMKDTLEWEVTERLTTTRGEFKVFSTPSMCLLAEMASHKLAAPHLKAGQGQVGLTINIRHMAPTPLGKMVRAETELVKGLGFTGKSLVNPRQITVVHEVFRPKPGEIEHALEVLEAIKKAREMGTGVISLRGRMVDAPVVKRAARTIRTAVAFGMLDYELSDEVIHGHE